MAGASLKDPNLNEFQVILIIIITKIREKWEILQYSVNFPLISLKISHDFYQESSKIPLKILHFLCSINPPKIPKNSAGNLREIPEESLQKFTLKFRVDSWFNFNPNFCVDSLTPSFRHPRRFHTESTWFWPLG